MAYLPVNFVITLGIVLSEFSGSEPNTMDDFILTASSKGAVNLNVNILYCLSKTDYERRFCVMSDGESTFVFPSEDGFSSSFVVSEGGMNVCSKGDCMFTRRTRHLCMTSL